MSCALSPASRTSKVEFEFELLSSVWRPLERRSNQRNRRRQITKHQLGFDANQAVAEPRKLAIAASVRRAAARMIAAIHLDDELDARRAEISNEASTDRHLPAKANAELARVERGPEASLRLGEARAVLQSEDHLSWSPVCGVARRSC